jgi:opacity protein-like surface antigen
MRHHFFALLLLLSLNAQADTQPDPRRIKGFVGITGGFDWATISESTTVLLLTEAPAPDTFTPDNIYSSNYLFGVSAGVEFPVHTIGTIWQTSLAYYTTGDFEITGVEYMFGQSDLGNKAYSYDVSNQRLMLENKLMFSLRDRYYSAPGFYMYLMFGLGASRNEASNFKLTALEPTTIPEGEFESNSANSFTYSVGIGFESELASVIRVGFGYRYADLGKVTLGPFDEGNTANTISTTSTPTQELIFQVTIL